MKKRRAIIEFNLSKLGIAPCLQGFWYIRRAIESQLESDIEKNILDIYKEFAEENGVGPGWIENSISYAIGKVDVDAYKEIGGYSLANADFISTLALLVKNKLESEE